MLALIISYFSDGSETLPRAMEEKILTKPTHSQRAVSVKETDDGQSITVTFESDGESQDRKYSNVISTLSMGCLRMVNLDEIYLSYGQRNAIRELTYTSSIKIGIQFKSAWWGKLDIAGGQSYTDRPIRTVVYPSYGLPDVSTDPQQSNVMIASYNGMQDAQRLGGLMKGPGTPEEKVLLDLVMRDLAVIHSKDIKELWNEFEDYFPWDWSRDQYQLGRWPFPRHVHPPDSLCALPRCFRPLRPRSIQLHLSLCDAARV